MDIEVKQFVKDIIDDARGQATMAYSLVTIIYALHEIFQSTGIFETEKYRFNEHALKLIEASLIAKRYLDVEFEIEE